MEKGRGLKKSRREERNYKDLLNNVSDAIISTDPEYRIIFWNRAAEEIYGWKEEDVIGKILRDVVPINYSEVSRDEVIKTFFEAGEWEGETEQYSKEGKLLYVHSKVRLIRDGKGNPSEIIAVNRDVTSRREVERNLYMEKEVNAALADISKIIISPHMTVEEIARKVHKAALSLTGGLYGYASSIDPRDESNVIHTFSEMMDSCAVKDKRIAFPKSESGYRGLWGHSLNTRRGFYTNTPVNHQESVGIPEGHIPLNNFLSVPALFNEVPLGQIALADKAGGFSDIDLEVIQKLANIYAIAIFRTQTERELYEALEKVKESDRLKSTFLASMSHEIRTPLNAILGFLDIVLSEEGLKQEHRDFLSQAKKSGEILLQLINDILDFSKIEAEELKLEKMSFSVKDLLKSLETFAEVLIKEKNIEIRATVPDEADLIIESDPYRLEQILINLISNAVKFTEEGLVEFGVGRKDSAMLEFFVSDTGTGIPEEKREIIFEAFRQAEEKTTRRYGGTGLGLAITKRLVEKMGGNISFTSVPGKGTTFYVILPFEIGDLHVPEKNGEIPPSEKTGSVLKEVLIVEDNEINRRVITTMLNKGGFVTREAKDGNEALSILREDWEGERRIGLVLMDMYMPNLDGVETTRSIRKSEESRGLSRLPVIALTAAGTTEDRELMMNAGCDDYLSKPVNREMLFKLCREKLSS